MGFSVENLAFVFGLLGNIISFFVFLSPLPTFYKIYKKKSTEGFQSVPYVVALFSAMLLMYYAFLKSNATLLITINSFGCFIETIYIGLYLFYAPKKIKVQTLKLLALMSCGFGLIVILTHFLAKGSTCLRIVGWICLVFSVSVFVAPLGIVKQVIQTKSVEFMPFSLTLSLTLNAVMWFFYGLLIKDFNIAIPNVLGFVFGVIQMVLYLMYKNTKKVVEEQKVAIDEVEINQVRVLKEEAEMLPEVLVEQVIDVVKLSAMVCPEIVPLVPNIFLNEMDIVIDHGIVEELNGVVKAK
ncbi:bidirectional sugar transporter NEC1-like [Actinidia eriantha]|uniref:bidirectional sugar transporter NEC1-like n=1 Tax=Actinidia eriantha TaxID=165200 RepID=UPI00258E9AE6|nr:bidirectional sugar transporter NEC1-like [Actinidia eriantha]